MARNVLIAQRVTRIGGARLETLTVSTDTAADEAGIGRGLYIGNCPDGRIVTQLCYAIRNALPSSSVVVPCSYELSEQIASKLEELRIDCWRAIRDSRDGVGDGGAPVQIAIPEKLFLLDARVRKGHSPAFMHVVAPQGHVNSYSRELGGRRCRADNISRYKAVCEANGVSPYAIFWTAQPCACLSTSRLNRSMGVDAWIYVDGRTVRCACFAEVPQEESQARSHWLDSHVHRAHVSGSRIVIVFGGSNGEASWAVKDLARLRDYPVIDVSQLPGLDRIKSDPQFLEQGCKQLRNAVQRENRQVTVLTGFEKIGCSFEDRATYALLRQASRFATVVAADGGRKPSIPEGNEAGYPVLVDCSTRREA